MGKKIRLLIIEDSEDDKDLLLLHLKRGGLDVMSHQVETRAELAKALHANHWDLIISDYSMPSFDGISALKAVKETGLDIPFILISGAIGEEIAVEAMKTGASDYFMKDNLTRLIPAIKREVREAKNRAEHKKNELQKQRLEQLVQQSLNEIYIFDSTTLQFEYVNKFTLQNLGYTREELLKCTPLDVKKEYSETSFRLALQPLLLRDKKKIVLNTFHQRKDGTEYPVEAHVQIIEERNRKLYAATVLDLTSHKRSENIILKQKKLAKQLALNSKYKSEFMANMSHELRTPLNSIILLSKLLNKKRENLPDNGQGEYIEEIHKSAHSLMALINDVLDVSKIEAGEMRFNIEEMPVSDLLNSVAHSFELLAKEKGLQFATTNRVDSGFMMTSDPMRVEQILNNFLSNAFKFTENGSVSITAYTPTQEEFSHLDIQKKQVIAFAVKDTGIGIDEKNLRNIFEAFQQADSSDERRYKGTGLGLSISKQIANSLGGAISVDSEPGEGSRFTVYLPVNSTTCIEQKNLRVVKSVQKLVSSSDPNVHSFSQERNIQLKDTEKDKKHSTILLADDNDLHVSALKELIDEKTKTCLVADTAKKTYSKLDETSIDLLILDLGLPDADGLDVIKTVRKKFSKAQLPIIVYTGRDLSQDIKREFAERVNAFVTKTAGSFQSLQKAIESIPGIGTQPLPQIQTNKELHHFKDKKVLIVDDDERNLYSLSKSLEDLPLRLYTEKNGLDALHFLENNGAVDLILMDMMMPKMNGYMTISKIKENNRWAEIPIIAVTAKVTTKDKQKCLRAGASDFVPKPIDIDYLFAKMNHWLKKKSAGND